MTSHPRLKKIMSWVSASLFFSLISLAAPNALPAEEKPRARDLGIPFEGTPGEWNAITDVKGVEVGQSTIIFGEGKLDVGKGPARTGVTAICPLGLNALKKSGSGVPAAYFALNGAGEMTGTIAIEEFGVMLGPVLITNSVSIGTVRDAVIAWSREYITDPFILFTRTLPVVAETWDGFLNDIFGFHVQKHHVFEALNTAKGGPVAEGNVGGGTGMSVFQFKGGIGTASRVVQMDDKKYTVGVLVQANFGGRHQLRIAGVPVGLEITDLMPAEKPGSSQGSSIIIIVATDTPLLPIQLKSIAKRAAMGLARTGSTANWSSGDIFLAFSTANPYEMGDPVLRSLRCIPTPGMTPFYEATVQATEEAIINALIAAETMTGIDGHTVYAIPHDRLKQVLKKYNRLVE